MLAALVAMVIGVLFACETEIALYLAIALFGVALISTITLRTQALTLFTLAALGSMLTSIEQSRFRAMPSCSRDVVAYRLEVEGGRWATLKEWYDLDGEWHKSEAKVLLLKDSTVRVQRGEAVVAIRGLTPIRELSSHFERSIRRQGARGVVRLSRRNIIEWSPSHPTLHSTMHNAAMERLSRLTLSTEAKALSQATTLGSRTEISGELSNAFAQSGVQHLLAISGLHIGVVILLASLLFAPLALLTHGQVWRSIAVIIALWCFVLCTTMPTSVIRAATMLTLLYICAGRSSHYNPINALAATALLLITLDTTILFDIGFQLTFVAVAAILTLLPPIHRVLQARVARPLALLLESLSVGALATIAITPIVSSAFGYISPLSPLVTLPMLPLLYIVVSTSLLWILLPSPLWQGAAQWLIESSSRAMVYITEAAAQWPASQISYRMREWSVVIFYLGIAIIYLIIMRLNQKN